MKSSFFALLSLGLTTLAVGKDNLPPGVAASVNGEPISEKLVQTFIKNNCEALGIDRNTDEGRAKIPRVREAVIDELIERALVAQEVKRRGIAPGETELAAAEKTMIEYLGDERHFEDFLKLNGFTREEYREHILRNEAAGKALSGSLIADLAVSADEVKKFYEAHQKEPALQWPERVTAAHILFNTVPSFLREQIKTSRKLAEGVELENAVAGETERKRELAEKVRDEAAKPRADFAALAKEYSEDPGTRNQGGQLGTFVMGAHAAELDRVAFATAAGEVGPVVRSDSGFHVVKVFEHKPAATRTLEEASQVIRQQMLRAKQATRLKDWLASARKSAAVVIATRSEKSNGAE